MTHAGFATAEASRRYADGFAAVAAAGHYRLADGLTLSSIGIGTYLGEADEVTDDRYRHSVRRAVEWGCNVIDTASNYRCQRSERAIGDALGDLVADGFAREACFIATKGGYLPFDDAPPDDLRAYIADTLLAPGLATSADIVNGHCMAPGFIADQLAQSLQNLRLDTLDAYYLHNPESQLPAIGREAFERRLRSAFEGLELAVAAGQVRRYGVATWNGFRTVASAPGFHDLSRMVALAREVAGDRHHFGIIQLPFNLVMTEALTLRNHDGQAVLDRAQDLGLMVMTSASILQAQLASGLPADVAAALPDLRTDAQRALQITRSAPGVTSALVGMSRVAHVEENLHLVGSAPLAPASFQPLIAGRG